MYTANDKVYYRIISVSVLAIGNWYFSIIKITRLLLLAYLFSERQ